MPVLAPPIAPEDDRRAQCDCEHDGFLCNKPAYRIVTTVGHVCATCINEHMTIRELMEPYPEGDG